MSLNAPQHYREYVRAGYTRDVLGVIPPGATLARGSTVHLKMRGKAPGQRNADGSWSGRGGKWSDEDATVADCKAWQASKANLGLQTRNFPAIDIDVEDEAQSRAIVKLAIAHLGMAPVRYRDGSPRRLMLYKIAGEPMRKRRTAYVDAAGVKHAVEALGKGQMFVAEGTHPSGQTYKWEENFGPCECGPGGLTGIDGEALDEFFAAVARFVQGIGGTVHNSSTASDAVSTRKSLDNPSLHAPNPEMVLDALKAMPNDLGTHDGYVAVVAATKAALGPRRDEFKGEVIEWSLGYAGNTEEYAEKVYDSVIDAANGWSYLVSLARKHGYNGDAQTDFDEPPPEWIGGEPPQAMAAQRTLKLLHLDELETLPEPNDFVEGLLCDGQASVFFGDANVGKSFVALDLAMHVALGWDWHGRQIERGGVIYIASEGSGGMKRRVRAFRQEHGFGRTAGAQIALVPETVNFREDEAVKPLLDAAKAVAARWKVPVRWIVVDTLSRALAGGNENAPEDMGALLKSAARLQAETGAHLTLIHHSGKDDTRGARGHSSLRAAIDTELKFERVDGERSIVRASVTKQRDMELGSGFAFKLRVIALGDDRRGKPVTSCVVEPAKIEVPLTDAERASIEILNSLMLDGPDASVALGDWRAAVLSGAGVITGQTPDTRGKQWQRLRDGLKKKGIIAISGDRVELRDR